MISVESGHFGVVNGEVTTVVDPVVRETPRKNSTNGVIIIIMFNIYIAHFQ